MTHDDIERLAVEHETFGFGRVGEDGLTIHGFEPEGLAAFVAALRAQVLEEAALACERLYLPQPVIEGDDAVAEVAIGECAAAIRAMKDRP